MKRRECKKCGMVNDMPTGKVIQRYLEPYHFCGILSMGVTSIVECPYCGRRWRYHRKIKLH